MNDKQLKIYSASAGSGKTFTLAKEFISLLVERPEEYKNILAVTFTVKATNEMKERILSNLHKISINDPKDGPQLIGDQQTLHPELTEGEIRTRCRRALNYFLNDYSQFNIMTIDGFVQKVIRAFAYEANLPSHYEITLDKEDIVQQAITNLYAQIKTDPKLESWIRQYTQETMEDSGRWNVERSISNICGDLIDQKEKLGTGTDIDKLTAFINTLKKEIDNGKKIIVDTLKKAKADLSSIVDFEKYIKKAFYKNLYSFNGTDYDYFDFFKDELKKADKKSGFEDHISLENLYSESKKGCPDFISRSQSMFEKVEKDLLKLVDFDTLANYYTALAIKNNIYTTGLWNYIQNNISNITTAESLMLISQSNELLKELIAGSNIPFIYEKVGAKFDNIMIDEFQDTSHIQWDNFRPLVENAMGTRGALVVGDVKQAIYRWRNSDWNLLAHQVKKDFDGKYKEEKLETNYRSEANIIKFNNVLFAGLSSKMAGVIDQLKCPSGGKVVTGNIYKTDQLTQKIPSKKEEKPTGYVSVTMVKTLASNAKKEDKEPLERLRLNYVYNSIRELHKKHYEYRRICILVRGKKDAGKVVDFLANPVNVDENGPKLEPIPLISSDSLLLDASPIVQAIVAHLKYIDNQQNNALLAYALTYNNTDNLLEKWENKDEYAQEILALRGMGLIEMTNAIIEKLDQDWVNNQLIFVDAFRNLIYTFTTKKHPNLADFLEYYDSKKEKLTVEMPENQDAVRLMTIHKSKGLEFDAVLIPYLNWDNVDYWTAFKQQTMWSELKEPFDVPGKSLLRFEKSLDKTLASSHYLEEAQQQIIDNLNLTYVALTRPKKALYVWTDMEKEDENKSKKGNENKSKEDTSVKNVSKYFNEVIKDLADKFTETIGEDGSYCQYTFGEIPEPTDDKKEKEENRLPDLTISAPLPTSPWNERDRKKFGRIALTDKTKDGTAKHAIMEKIVTLEDLEKYAQKAVTNGQMNNSESTSFITEVATEINNLNIAHWFDGSMTVYNETAMVAPDNEKRPDRVMVDKDNNVHVVDYKFYSEVTPKKRSDHEKQVRNYMWMLKKTNLFNRVTGNVWYYNQHEIMPVTL